MCGKQIEGGRTSSINPSDETAYLPQRQQQSQQFSNDNTIPIVNPAMQPARQAAGGQSAAQQASFNRTPIIVAAVVAAAILVFAIVFFLVLRPQSGADSRYTIQFETDGGTTVAAMQIDKGAQVTSPTDPSKDGYEFEGWYTDSARTKKATFPFAADENTVLYAKWTEKKDVASPSGSSADTSNNSQNAAPIVIYNNNGTPNTYTQTRPSSGYILPNSSSAYLSERDVSHLSNDDLSRAMNEIWARHGRRFKNNWLQSYFNSMSWYRGTVDPDAFSSVYTPTDIENKNAELSNAILSERGYDVNRAHPN